MGMNVAEIDAVLRELGELVGASLDGAWQPARDRVVLGIGGTRVLLVPRGDGARLHRIEERSPNPRKPYSFQGALRTRLGARLEQITRVAGERAVDLSFDGFSIHLRLTGRSGGLWLLENGRPVVAHDGPAAEVPPFPPHPPRQEPAQFSSPGGAWGANRAAEAWFAARELALVSSQRRAGALTRGRRELTRALRKIEHLDGDLERATASTAMREEADLLATALHLVHKGATSIDLDDLAGGPRRSIPLDPARSAGANLQAMYARAKRLERAGEQAAVRRAAAAIAVELLRNALTAAEKDDSALQSLEELAPLRVAPARNAAAVPWIRWVGPAGQEVLVGRNAAGNRRLTFQRARGHDWWMHRRDAPGAHLVIPTRREQSPPLAVLLAAAQICLHSARVPPGASADVAYARVRDVRAIPGEAGGQVTIHAERVLRVTADPRALDEWAIDAPVT